MEMCVAACDTVSLIRGRELKAVRAHAAGRKGERLEAGPKEIVTPQPRLNVALKRGIATREGGFVVGVCPRAHRVIVHALHALKRRECRWQGGPGTRKERERGGDEDVHPGRPQQEG